MRNVRTNVRVRRQIHRNTEGQPTYYEPPAEMRWDVYVDSRLMEIGFTTRDEAERAAEKWIDIQDW